MQCCIVHFGTIQYCIELVTVHYCIVQYSIIEYREHYPAIKQKLVQFSLQSQDPILWVSLLPLTILITTHPTTPPPTIGENIQPIKKHTTTDYGSRGTLLQSMKDLINKGSRFQDYPYQRIKMFNKHQPTYRGINYQLILSFLIPTYYIWFAQEIKSKRHLLGTQRVSAWGNT